MGMPVDQAEQVSAGIGAGPEAETGITNGIIREFLRYVRNFDGNPFSGQGAGDKRRQLRPSPGKGRRNHSRCLGKKDGVPYGIGGQEAVFGIDGESLSRLMEEGAGELGQPIDPVLVIHQKGIDDPLEAGA